MNYSFPSRFLKKLDIYQQIRWGQGISKYKDSWKYESRFLQVAYESPHQHLDGLVVVNDCKSWMSIDGSCGNYQLILGNLYFRGYLEAYQNGNKKFLTRDNNDMLILDAAFDEKYRFRPSYSGLLVGEIISEVNNKNCFVKYLNRYKYSLIIDDSWLIIIGGILMTFTPDLIDKFRLITISSFKIDYIFITLLLFLFWPLFTYIFRSFILNLEKNH